MILSTSADLIQEFALSVIKQFFLDNNIEESKLVTVAKLEKKPIRSNKTQQGRAKNRRAEVTLFR